VGREVFQALQDYADLSAIDNGRSVGNLEATSFEDYAQHVRNAGVIAGVEHAINFDPFEEERDEDQGIREISPS